MESKELLSFAFQNQLFKPQLLEKRLVTRVYSFKSANDDFFIADVLDRLSYKNNEPQFNLISRVDLVMNIIWRSFTLNKHYVGLYENKRFKMLLRSTENESKVIRRLRESCYQESNVY